MTVYDVLPTLYCQICCQQVGDAYEQDWDSGDDWVYCRNCDAWTSHPAKGIDLGPQKGPASVAQIQAQTKHVRERLNLEAKLRAEGR